LYDDVDASIKGWVIYILLVCCFGLYKGYFKTFFLTVHGLTPIMRA
jgi:hypothetical protein